LDDDRFRNLSVVCPDGLIGDVALPDLGGCVRGELDFELLLGSLGRVEVERLEDDDDRFGR
jgi:hypothetical protein